MPLWRKPIIFTVKDALRYMQEVHGDGSDQPLPSYTAG